MVFAELAERVIYNKNPLAEVICQFRYPSVLRIDTDLPVDFHEKIQSAFPVFREKTNILSVPPEIAQLISPEIVKTLNNTVKAYEFATKENNWIVSLTRDFIALTNSRYKRWEDFYEMLEQPFLALDKIYSPSFFSRVGLRYRNVIKRSELDLNGVDWSLLINPVLSGFFSVKLEDINVVETNHLTLLTINTKGDKVRIRYGTEKDNKTDEICFVIDSDFFTEEQKDIKDGLAIISEFNRANRNLFRWCITEQLHNAMEPTTL